MEIVEQLEALRAQVQDWRAAGARIGFVPTMGNLHQGHLSLIEQARARADRVVCSIFVNPTQFGPSEDFQRYPRTPEQDAELLRNAGCDLLFLPPVEVMYPLGVERALRIEVPGLSNVLCGAHRPGHFAGVATVVCRLFNMVQADLAVFGRKDYQQLALIERMVADLSIPVEIVGAPTGREADGLAMSSRNQYLDAEQRGRAPVLYRTLCAALKSLQAGQAPAEIEARATRYLQGQGFEVDYVVLRDAHDLESIPAGPAEGRHWICLLAARLGKTRLIDNVAMADLPADARALEALEPR
ncbi:pantoate--beta-alanine ligase [Pseudomarimonas arenosa]|uniref:Pantothenate synthetase n=1 Tax=Pseudomarimonas arenosa TaxID=2774145 RepID=A0AAW3ZKI5_9GAMM|nr:pantoate--beta-alanine ligase [Pseudomarimonas arenosa]MBD8526531.1 pantoate--beta-alanine ligase [Pseudomarimonas arenosa]